MKGGEGGGRMEKGDKFLQYYFPNIQFHPLPTLWFDNYILRLDGELYSLLQRETGRGPEISFSSSSSSSLIINIP